MLENSARVMVEVYYSPSLHGELEDGQAAMVDGVQVIRQGSEAVCIGVL